MMTEFKREQRYAVRKFSTGKLVDCVVVEKDWTITPIFDTSSISEEFNGTV
jgi:hypothetical protein